MMSVGSIKNSVLHTQTVAATIEFNFGNLLGIGRVANVANRDAAFFPSPGVQIPAGNHARLRLADSHHRDLTQLRRVGNVDDLHAKPALSDKGKLVFQCDPGREFNGVVMRQQFRGRPVRNINDEQAVRPRSEIRNVVANHNLPKVPNVFQFPNHHRSGRVLYRKNHQIPLLEHEQVFPIAGDVHPGPDSGICRRLSLVFELDGHCIEVVFCHGRRGKQKTGDKYRESHVIRNSPGTVVQQVTRLENWFGGNEGGNLDDSISDQVTAQLMGAVSVAVYTIIATYIILNIIQITIGLRVDRNSEV